jgi:hypothetical protein
MTAINFKGALDSLWRVGRLTQVKRTEVSGVRAGKGKIAPNDAGARSERVDERPYFDES